MSANASTVHFSVCGFGLLVRILIVSDFRFMSSDHLTRWAQDISTVAFIPAVWPSPQPSCGGSQGELQLSRDRRGHTSSSLHPHVSTFLPLRLLPSPCFISVWHKRSLPLMLSPGTRVWPFPSLSRCVQGRWQPPETPTTQHLSYTQTQETCPWEKCSLLE